MCQENRGEVGEGVETLADDSIKSKQLNEGLKDANQSTKPIVNWAEFLFKNKEALEEVVKGQTDKRGPRNSGSKETIVLEEWDFGNINLGLDLNAGKNLIGVDAQLKLLKNLELTVRVKKDLLDYIKAKEALALGKRLGVEIEGNEEGALKELVCLESQN
ncbi:hypothetical protein V6N13_005559 [Hibiscus sabdariffa]|uniref:Uncharacterized protein n=1 Tax=Hibiscus sabdariffa TaxID=183260 RepID=A0ABR2ESB4_9ROSI